MMILPLAALLAAVPPLAPNPSTVAAVETTAGVSRRTASELANTIAPAGVIIRLQMEQARKAVLALPSLDEAAKELEQEHPGIYLAVWAAVEPEMRRSLEAEHPPFLAALEQLYMARLSEREAQALLTFYKSATGQKLLGVMYGSFDVVPMLTDMAKSESWTVSERQMEAATQSARARAVQQMGEEDKPALMALATSIDLKKAREIGAESQRLTLEWVNKEDPEAEEKIGKIMEEAMERFIAARAPAK